jgi:hypothetical protein
LTKRGIVSSTEQTVLPRYFHHRRMSQPFPP